MEESNDTYTLLCVFYNEDHVPGFDKVLCHDTIRQKFQNKLKVRLSTYENFLEDKLEDNYDFVLLVFMSDVDGDELETQQDHYVFYSQVPVVHWCVSHKVMKDEGKFDSLASFVKDHLEERLVSLEPIVLDQSTQAAAQSLTSGLDAMIEAYVTKKNTEVKQAFDQFDVDGSGAIDKDELQLLSQQLGHPLTEQELEKALVDLDLDKNGVIDFDEFCRWYFTGMKPFNGSTRSMLQVGSKTSSIFDALAREKLTEIIQSDRSLSKHRISLAFNEPAEAYVAQMSMHFCGPFSESIAEKAQGFRELLGTQLQQELGVDYMNEYFEIKIPMKDGHSYKQYIKPIEEMFAPGGPINESSMVQAHIKFFPMDKQLLVRFYLSIRTTGPKIPDIIREALKDVDQYFKIKMVSGIDGEELLTVEKPLVEHLMKGFKNEYEFVFLKNLKKVAMEAIKDSSLAEFLKVMGPAFALTSNSSVDLTFDDFEEIREHPMANQFLVSLPQVIEGTFGEKIPDLLKYKPDFSSVNRKEFDKYVKNSEYGQKKMKMTNLYTAIASLLREFSPDFRATMEASLFGFIGLKYELQGAGYGELALLLFTCLTIGEQKRNVKYLIDDFEESKAEGQKA